MKGISPKFPLMFDNTFGCYALNQTYAEVVQQNLKNLILTSPGERVMDINFGVGLRHYFFEPMTNSITYDITTALKEQVDTYMPFVTISTVNYNTDETIAAANPNLLSVSVAYIIAPLNESGLLTIETNT